MLLPKFDFYQPGGLKEACEIMAAYQAGAKVLAGGTDLLVNMKRKLVRPDHVVSLDGLADLRGVSSDRETITIGANTTIAGLVEDRTIGRLCPVLVQAGRLLGSPPIRNRATVGGNLATARPAGDMAPPLMALDARVLLVSLAGAREVSLDDFFLGPGQSVIRPDEVMTGILVPGPAPLTGGGYEKLGVRRTMVIGLVNAAAVLTLDQGGRKIKSARIVLGAVGPTPIRSPEAEAVLAGAVAGPKAFAAAGRAAIGDSCAITDFRGSLEYRCDMVEVLVRRALETAFRAAGR